MTERREAIEGPPASPPHDTEAERFVLAAMLFDARVVDDVVLQLDPRDFYAPAHQAIFEAIHAVHRENGHVDIVTVQDAIRRLGRTADVAGGALVIEIASLAITAAGVMHHAEIVKGKAVLRSLLEVSTEVAGMTQEATVEAADVIQRAEERIFEIAHRGAAQHPVSIDVVAQTVFERLDEANRTGRKRGVLTGYARLDEMTNGLQPGDLVILAARPSMGKTTFALNLSERAASLGTGVLVFSIEMSSEQVFTNMLCSAARVDRKALQEDRLTNDEVQRVNLESARLSEAPLIFDDSSTQTPTTIRAKARREKRRHDIGLIVIDYIQLMTTGGRIESRQQEVASISRSLKALARELGVPVVALAQLNRDVVSREDHRPRMSDLRESGALEQDADVVMLLHREHYYSPTTANEGVADLIVAKQRNGPVGDVLLRFFPQHMRFESFDGKRKGKR